jgi:broad specificity phosphatase PhoE
MTEIILIRHGQTQWNASEIFRGRADIPLDETGFKQAALLGAYLKAEPISAVYSGPLSRAVKTAEAVAKPHKLKVNVISSLDDIDCGEWQGKPLTEVKELWDDVYQDWLDTPEQVRLPGGESLDEVLGRVFPFADDAVKRHRDGCIVFVSHRAVLKVLVCALLGLDNSSFWNLKIDNCGITRFTLTGKRIVMTVHNDTSFLKPLQKSPLNDF